MRHHHPDGEKLPYRERYIEILQHIDDGDEFINELTQGIDIKTLSPEKQFPLEYSAITNLARKQNATAMLDFIDSASGHGHP